MTKPWTYLSLKAVFQYMDADQRLDLNFHCPALRSAEVSVPLNLQSLTLKRTIIVANDVCYKVESKSQRIKSILDGRKHVCVEILKIHDSNVIPDSLKISTKILDSGDLHLEEVLPFINEASFPLRKLRANIAKTPNLKKYLRCTQKLILFETNYNEEQEDLVRSILYDRECPNIVLETHVLSSDTTVTLIQNWRDNQKEIGTVLTMQNGFRFLPIVALNFDEFLYIDELREVLDGRTAYLNNSVLQNNMDRRCISFPFNQTCKVVLYNIRDEPSGNLTTKLEVMPIGSIGEGPLFDFLTFWETFRAFPILSQILIIVSFLMLIFILLLLFCSLIE